MDMEGDLAVRNGQCGDCMLMAQFVHSALSIDGAKLCFSTGKQRRLQFVECANDINAMIDAAKFADLVLLLTDGSYGFEMVRTLHNDQHLEPFNSIFRIIKQYLR